MHIFAAMEIHDNKTILNQEKLHEPCQRVLCRVKSRICRQDQSSARAVDTTPGPL